MDPPRQLHGRVRAISVETTQESWRFDVSSITGVQPGVPSGGPQGPLQEQQQPAMRILRNQPDDVPKEPAPKHPSDKDGTPADDDDDFMEPRPPRRPMLKKLCTNKHLCKGNKQRNENAQPTKPPTVPNAKNKVQYDHPPTARCAPAIFNHFVDHLTMSQRAKISNMGFGGLLQVSADGLESRCLLTFLMDSLNPSNMKLQIGKEKDLEITPWAVRKVLGLPIGGVDPPLPTRSESTEALSDFRYFLALEANEPVKIQYLQMLLMTGELDDETAIRFFFIVAFNKLLLPDTNNYIRGKDAYLTDDLSLLPGINWCKAVVDDLRDAAYSWKVDREKKGLKSISSCAILLIILYLDNLHCHHQITHILTPRVKFFDSNTIDLIKNADKTKDNNGKATYGKLHLRNSVNTCYYQSVPASAEANTFGHPVSDSFPSIQAELGVLVAQIVSKPMKREAMKALAKFDDKSRSALREIKRQQLKLQDAHQEVIRTLRSILEKEVNAQNNARHADHQPAHISTCHAATTSHTTVEDANTTSSAGVGPMMMPTANDLPNTEASREFSKVPDTIDNNLNGDNEREPVHREGGDDRHVLDALIDRIEASTDNQQSPELRTLNLRGAATENPVTLPNILENNTVPSTLFGNNADHMEIIPPAVHVAQQTGSNDNSTFDQQVTTTIALAHTTGTTFHCQSNAAPTVSNPPAVSHQQQPTSNHISNSAHQAEVTPLIAPVPRRSNRLTRVPEMYVSPFKSNINCPKVPATKANALRQKFCKSLKSSMDIFIAAGPNLFNGFDIFDSFGDSKMLSGKFMATYISFIRHDEQAHMPDGGGYRVFLSQELGEVLNIEEHEWDAEFSIQVAHDILKHDLLGIAPHKVKLFFLPVLHKDHWTVYCLNMIHTRIDVLDSSPADQRTYHEILADRIVPRLNELFQKVTNGGVKQFRRWKRPIIDLPKQFKDPDSGFLAIKNMVLWNGDALESQISPGRATVYRGEVLFFLMFHPLNEEKTLPGGLETFRPQP